MKNILFLIACLIASSSLQAQAVRDTNHLDFKIYGVINYYNFDWDTDPQKRDAFDTERLNAYVYYDITPKIKFKAELEWEHGGTGATLELDKFEEFGEFESEIEAGGEAKIDQVNIRFIHSDWLQFRVGRVKVYTGIASKLDLPTQYFTGYRSQMENVLLPQGWYENGIEILGDFGKRKQWSYKLYFVNGLNSEEFSSANWIKRGHQKKFEMVNAENMAYVARLDYNLPNKGFIGGSAYYGNSNKNRSKPKLDNVDGYVTILDAHAVVNMDQFILRAMYLYGNLQNSDQISDANNNLPNPLHAKRTPVAKNALGYYVSLGYDFMPFIKTKSKDRFILFARYDYYDSIYKTKEGYFNNPRWERKETTIGLNYIFDSKVALKAHYAINKLGIPTEDIRENTFLMGVGFNFNS